MKIIFITPYPIGQAPSQRFRFEQYFESLTFHNIKFHIQSFWDERTWKILYLPGNFYLKLVGLIKGFVRRLNICLDIRQYDFVFIHREASPIGPPIFEWMIAKLFGKKIIYDFDDAIWLPNKSEVNSIVDKFKLFNKIERICKWSYKISCGNDYLCKYAKQYNTSVVLNPTTIDTERLHNQVKGSSSVNKLVIGWTGTHSTLPYLNELLPIIQELEKQFEFTFCIISNQAPNFLLQSLKFIPWRKESEIEDLLNFDVGVMPLTDDEWSRGKCGFKALQYMALGIPPLVSPVGVNRIIVEDGVNGFICREAHDWKSTLSKLLSDKALPNYLGVNAQLTVKSKYSVLSNTNNFLTLFS